jgi:SAM-dependent methyltransferase
LRALPYLDGALRARFDAWLEAARSRQLQGLELRDVRKGVQALGALYLERRPGADLGARAREGRAKRAALATCYAPLHFLAVHHALASIGPARLGSIDGVVDLGCGTGGAGAAAAIAVGAARVLAIDRSGFALDEARRTLAAFGLHATTRRGRLPAAAPAPRPASLWVLGWVVNELDDAARDALLGTLQRALAGGVALLLLEPLAGPVSPWWRSFALALAPHGVEEPRFKVRLALPEWIARLDRAAGLDHRVLGARVLVGPLRPA